MIYRTYIKPLLDLTSSVISIIILSPLLLITAGLIIVVDGPPVIFMQDRIGINKKHFNIFKFKTMKDGSGLLLSYDNDPRVTKLGKLLRKYKIDELPQFFNVIIGQMSIVGPRPEVPKLAQKKFGGKYDIIFSVKPGITGLSSVEYINESKLFPKDGRNRYKIYFSKILPKKIKLDIEYINKMSLTQDLMIVLRTVRRLFG